MDRDRTTIERVVGSGQMYREAISNGAPKQNVDDHLRSNDILSTAQWMYGPNGSKIRRKK